MDPPHPPSRFLPDPLTRASTHAVRRADASWNAPSPHHHHPHHARHISASYPSTTARPEPESSEHPPTAATFAAPAHPDAAGPWSRATSALASGEDARHLRRNSYSFPARNDGPRSPASSAVLLEAPRHQYSLSHPTLQSMAHSYHHESPGQPGSASNMSKSHKGLLEPLPAPMMANALSSRNMPPPSPSQAYSTSHGAGTHLPPTPHSAPPQSGTFGMGRDLPSLSGTQRPSSGMSISSMIEPDSSRQLRGPASSSYLPPPASSGPAYSPMRGSLAEASPRTAPRPEQHGPSRDQYAPDDYGRPTFPGPREHHLTSIGSPRMPYPGQAEGPRANPYPPPLHAPPMGQGMHDASRMPDHHHRYDASFKPMAEPLDRMPPRSNSQPIHPTTHAPYGERPGHHLPPNPDPQVRSRDRSRTNEALGPRPNLMAEHHQPPYWDRERPEGVPRDRRSIDLRSGPGPGPNAAVSPSHPVQRSIYGPSEVPGVPLEMTGKAAFPQPHDPRNAPRPTRTPPPNPGPGLNPPLNPPVGMAAYPSSRGYTSHPSQHVARKGSPRGWAQRDHHGPRPAPAGNESNYGNGERRDGQPSEPAYPSSYSGPPHGAHQHVEDARAKAGVETQPNAQQAPRSLLSVQSEGGRRGGRNSPLPQAVQGAQSQLSGPGGEPGIKSEFGRMFSGIGSGVGGALAPASSGSAANGGTTPSMNVPSPRREGIPDGGGLGGSSIDTPGPHAIATGSRGVKRPRKAKDDAGKMDTEGGDGAATPDAPSPKGTKRNRHGHHHHYHPLGHHHHHHHLKSEDEPGSPSPAQPKLSQIPSADGGGLRSLTPTLSQSHGSTLSAHHHYHHHHHHHSVPPTSSNKPSGTTTATQNSVPPAPVIRQPTVTVLSQAVIQSVAHLPRRHLGSMVYAPRVSVAPFARQSKFAFATTPKPLPRVEGKENCTFTVRVPHALLTPNSREEVVRRRALWGTDIYTDDSDVVAAAIHTGWIRGEWGDEVDISLLDLGPSDSTTTTQDDKGSPARHDGEDHEEEHHHGEGHKKKKKNNRKDHSNKNRFSKPESHTILTSPPTSPPNPPPHKDMQLTLLILPPLERYASTVSRGLRSRAWGATHDGMSFRILKVEWIDHPRASSSSFCEERSGKARRERLSGWTKAFEDGGVRLRFGSLRHQRHQQQGRVEAGEQGEEMESKEKEGEEGKERNVVVPTAAGAAAGAGSSRGGAGGAGGGGRRGVAVGWDVEVVG